MMCRILPVHAKGGMQDHAWQLACALQKRSEIDVTFLTAEIPKDSPPLPPWVIGLPGVPPRGYRKYWKASREWIAQNARKFDLIHSQSAAARGLFFPRPKEIPPVIVSMHGTTIDEARSELNVGLKFPQSFKRAAKWGLTYAATDLPLLHGADAVIASSHQQEILLHWCYRVPKRKLRTVFTGMDCSQFWPRPWADLTLEEMRKRFGITEDHRVLLSLSRFAPDKFNESAIRILKELRDPKIKLLLIGDGEMRTHLETLVQDLDLKDQVFFTGYVEFSEIPYFFNLADVFLNTTLRVNGYDLTMIQAMASAVPTVASRLGSHPTVIPDESYGWLVDPRNFSEGAEAVRQALAVHPKFKARLRERALSLFSEEAMVHQFADKIYPEFIR